MTDRFELIEQVGKGGMGAVWKARDLETNEVIALKLLHAHLSDEEDYVQRLEREVEIAQRIDSPNVVRVLGYGVHDGIPYMAMEFVEGKSLRQLLRDDGPMAWDGPFGVREILRQVAAALAVVHNAGIIHRDIKPSNILVNDEGVVKVADFGISRAMDLTRVTGSATMLGTPAYMSPDVDQGPASDLYALGCVAFEMLTGTPPFEGHTQQEVLMRHMRDQPDLSRLPSASRRVVGKLLEKQVLSRPASAETLLALLAEEGGTGSNVRLWIAIAAPVGILGIAGAVIFGVMSRGGDTPVEAATVGPTASARATATPAIVSPSATPPPSTPTAPAPTPPPPTPTNTSLLLTTSATPTTASTSTMTPTSTPTSTSLPTATPSPRSTPTRTITPLATPAPPIPVITLTLYKENKYCTDPRFGGNSTTARAVASYDGAAVFYWTATPIGTWGAPVSFTEIEPAGGGTFTSMCGPPPGGQLCVSAHLRDTVWTSPESDRVCISGS